MDLQLPFLTLYTLVFFILCFSVFDTKKNIQDTTAFLVLLLFSFFAGFRMYNLDYDNYELFFSSTPDLIAIIQGKDFKTFVEPGFMFLITFIKLFTNEFNVFLFIIAFMSFFILLIACKKLTSNYLYIYILILSMSFYSIYYTQIRSGLACSIILYGVFFLLQRKYIRFIVIITFAVSIHSSAVLAYLFPLFVYVTPTIILLVIAASFSLCFTLFDVFGFIANALLSMFLPEVIVNKINLYVLSGRDNVKQSFFSISNALLIVSLYFCIYIKNKSLSILNKEKINLYFFIGLLALLSNNFFSFYGEVAGRFYRVGIMLMPFIWYYVYVISTPLNTSRLRRSNLPFLILAFMFFIYYGHVNKLVPRYQNFFLEVN